MVKADRRQEGEPDDHVLEKGLGLGRGASGHRNAATARVAAEHAHGDLAGRDQHNRQPPHLTDGRQRRQHAKDHELVGEGVEEGS
jgi:glucokinase